MENNIGAPKIQNNFSVFSLFALFMIIVLLTIKTSIVLPLKVIKIIFFNSLMGVNREKSFFGIAILENSKNILYFGCPNINFANCMYNAFSVEKTDSDLFETLFGNGDIEKL